MSTDLRRTMINATPKEVKDHVINALDNFCIVKINESLSDLIHEFSWIDDNHA